MPSLIQMPKSGETPEQVLTRALAEAQNSAFDDIIIIAQRSKQAAPEGGLVWFGRDDSTLAQVMFLLQSGLFHFNCIASGVKL